MPPVVHEQSSKMSSFPALIYFFKVISAIRDPDALHSPKFSLFDRFLIGEKEMYGGMAACFTDVMFYNLHLSMLK